MSPTRGISCLSLVLYGIRVASMQGKECPTLAIRPGVAELEEIKGKFGSNN